MIILPDPSHPSILQFVMNSAISTSNTQPASSAVTRWVEEIAALTQPGPPPAGGAELFDRTLRSLLQGLLLKQVMEHFRRQVACHRLQQSEGKMVAAIGKLALALGCETPEIAWSARPFLG